MRTFDDNADKISTAYVLVPSLWTPIIVSLKMNEPCSIAVGGSGGMQSRGTGRSQKTKQNAIHTPLAALFSVRVPSAP